MLKIGVKWQEENFKRTPFKEFQSGKRINKWKFLSMGLTGLCFTCSVLIGGYHCLSET